MNKLLISLLSLTGVAGISTGGYFLLKENSTEENKQQNIKADSGGGAKTVISEVSGGQSAPKPSDSPGVATSGSPQQPPPQTSVQGSQQ